MALTNRSVDQRDYPNNVNRPARGQLDSQRTQYCLRHDAVRFYNVGCQQAHPLDGWLLMRDFQTWLIMQVTVARGAACQVISEVTPIMTVIKMVKF